MHAVHWPDVKPRLLLVEDDPASRDVLLEGLSAHFRLEVMDDVLTAWRAARNEPPDAVIVNLQLQGLGSLTLIRCMRADERMLATPIVVLTDSFNRELLLRCLAAGASDFLLKPFAVSELLTCLQRKLDRPGASLGSSV